ncbi:MAG: dihydrolipoyllysine-residue succinyltransferase [Sphingomonadaceae bacterium]
MARLIEIITPQLSESVQSASLLAWRKQVGEAVERDEVVADLETDKVILEVSAPAGGVLAEIRVPAGGEASAGQVLAVIDAEAALMPTASAAPPVQAATAPTPEDEPSQGAQASATTVLPPSQRRAGRVLATEPAPACPPCPPCDDAHPRTDRRVPMSRLRLRIAERLKEAQNTAAMLTTFNEIDMHPVMELRKRYQERFQKEHGVKLGFMSFFVKAACQALKAYPLVNASIDGRDIVHHDYYDIGVAVSSERGLVVPILRDADRMSFAEIEQRIGDFARRANTLELKLEEMEGGTFTISNGGVFGSLLSTPILNPPQSGVLGLHRIQDRPVAEDGQVVIRPMMYVALSYDHRLVDGREAVSFLRVIKDGLEDPARLLLEL